MEELAPIVTAIPVMLLIALVTCVPILTALWAYGDAERRGKSGCLVAVLVLFLSWPLGLILWFVFRPEDPYRQRSG